ncbi:MAG: hypothetical protein KGN84_21770, partial [Acidobacteriota bacterium]|nr:hypothetical protein [Acidobacteriota bacterium]
AGCDVLYIANYYAKTVEMVSTGLNTSGSNNDSCAGGGPGSGGTFGLKTSAFATIASGAPTGIAFSGGQSSLGGNSAEFGPQGLFAQTPEPQSYLLVLLGLPAIWGFRKLRLRSARS